MSEKGPVSITAIANALLVTWKKTGKLSKYHGLNIADFRVVDALTYSNGAQLLLMEEGDDPDFDRDFGRELNEFLFKRGIYVDVEVRTEW